MSHVMLTNDEMVIEGNLQSHTKILLKQVSENLMVMPIYFLL